MTLVHDERRRNDPKLIVLLIEDDDLIRSGTADMTAELGHTVNCASDGESALRLLAETTADVLITDVGLPDFSGTDLARQAIQQWPGLKIIFASGDQGASQEAGAPNGINLTKPYTSDQIAAALSRAVSHKALS